MDDGPTRTALADVVSALAMTRTVNGKREMLKFKMQGTRTELSEWGHEYVRSLAGEIGQEYHDRQVADPPKDCGDLLELVHVIVPFHFKHNAEPEAIDLLMETEQVGTLADADLVTADNHAAVCMYMLRCADYLADHDEEKQMLEVAFTLYRRHGLLTDALRVALRLGDEAKITGVMEECEDTHVKKQMGYILARQSTAIVEEDDEDLAEIMGNLTLSETFLGLAKELDVLEPKTPQQIYKSHLSETGTTASDDTSAPESARGNLASSFVNAFVNAGFLADKLLTPADSKWVFKHKDHGLISAAAAYGMVVMWSVDNLTDLDDLLEDKSDNVKAGAVRGWRAAACPVHSVC